MGAREDADAAVTQLEELYRAGLRNVGLSDLQAEAVRLGTLGAWDNTAVDKAIVTAMQDIGPRIDRWALVWRRWAEAGRRDDGTPYGWERWLQARNEFAASIGFFTRAALESAPIAVVADTVDATVQTLADAPAAVVAAAEEAVQEVKDGAEKAASALATPIKLGLFAGVLLAIVLVVRRLA